MSWVAAVVAAPNQVHNTPLAVTPRKLNVICQSAVDGATADDKLALAVNGMMCSVWRNFQLDAYSRGSFGRSFSKMDVEDEKIKKAIEATGLSGDDFCVPLNRLVQHKITLTNTRT